MDEARIGLLYNNECRQGSCWQVSHSDDNRPYSSLMRKYISVYYSRVDGIHELEIQYNCM